MAARLQRELKGVSTKLRGASTSLKQSARVPRLRSDTTFVPHTYMPVAASRVAEEVDAYLASARAERSLEHIAQDFAETLDQQIAEPHELKPQPRKVPPAQMSFGTRVRKSAFFDSVREAGFSAWTVYNHTFLPLTYETQEDDFDQLTNRVQAWDVSCQRQVQISGPGAAAFTQMLTTRDLSGLEIGQSKYAPMCDETGQVINDPIVLRVAPDTYWLSIADSDVLLWAKGLALGMGASQVQICEPDVSCLAVQGPLAPALMRDLFGGNFKEPKYYWFIEAELHGIPIKIARAGWSAERGYEIYLDDRRHGRALWELVMKAGEGYGIKPGSPNNIRRLEAALLSIGNEEGNPFELGLEQIVHLDGDFDFMGKAALQKARDDGLRRKLVGIEIEGAPIAGNQHKWSVLADGVVGTVGHVTSVSHSPRLGKNIALAMIDLPHHTVGNELTIEMEGDCETRRGQVAKLPWVPSNAVTKKAKGTVS